MIPITLAEAKQLTHGTTLYHMRQKNTDGTHQKWKVTGTVQTWETELNKVSVPLKRGMYEFSHLTERNLWSFSLNDK